MTKKRYRVDTSMIIDQKNGDILSLTKAKNKLNTYDERLKDKDGLLKKQLKISQALNDELQKYDKLLDRFIENERTELGKSVLKQYKAAINGGIKTA